MVFEQYILLKTLIKKLLRFIKYPKWDIWEKNSFRDTVSNFLWLFAINLIGSLILAAIIRSLFSVENIAVSEVLEQWHPIKLLVYGSILIPIFEESLFRLVLKPKALNIGVTSFSIIYFSLTKLLEIESLFYFKTNLNCIIRLLVSIFCGILVYLISVNKSKQILKFWSKNFAAIFYSSGILFALLHLGNYIVVSPNNTLIASIVVMPHFFSALIFGYARLKHGFTFGTLMHIVNNLVVLSFLIATKGIV